MTGIDDARAAVEAGADAVGCLVGLDYDAPDRVEPEAARTIFAAMPPFITRVLVTHRTTVGDVVALARATGAAAAQLHGDFPLASIPELRRALPYMGIVKCVHVVDEASIDEALRAAEAADAVLLDSRTADRIGGTGRVHDWSISARIVARSPKPVILAGGLTPENVREAIERVAPWGVDVNSGVRRPDGRKSQARIAAFVAAAKSQGIR
jgi:phosphoribosylanthranilate isomerase